MKPRATLALIVLALFWFGLASLTAAAQQRERRCYFGECPDEDSPRPPPADSPPPVDRGGPPDPGQDPSQYTSDLPHYCCTAVGPLGPYPNPGPYGEAMVGTPCSGIAPDGLFYQGTACYQEPSTVTMPPVPSFCCTAVGRFGPFPNPGWPEGSACWSQTMVGPMQGTACY